MMYNLKVFIVTFIVGFIVLFTVSQALTAYTKNKELSYERS